MNSQIKCFIFLSLLCSGIITNSCSLNDLDKSGSIKLVEPEPAQRNNQNKPAEDINYKWDTIPYIYIDEENIMYVAEEISKQKNAYIEKLELIGEISSMSQNIDRADSLSSNVAEIGSKIYIEKGKRKFYPDEPSILYTYFHDEESDTYYLCSDGYIRSPYERDISLGSKSMLMLKIEDEWLICHGVIVDDQFAEEFELFGNVLQSIDYDELPSENLSVNILSVNSEIFIERNSEEIIKSAVIHDAERNKNYFFQNFLA